MVDVNTGKYIGEDNLQDTILNANIEAAEEIARQLRLRDLSGSLSSILSIWNPRRISIKWWMR